MRYSLLGLVLFVAVGCAALMGTVRAIPGSSTPYWWSSVVVTLTAAFMGICMLGAVFSRGQARCGWAGAAMAGAVYWVLIFSTWFGGSVGTRLISSRAIVWAEQKLYAAAQQNNAQQVAYGQFMPLVGYPMGPGAIGPSGAGYSPYINVGSGMVATPGGGGSWPAVYYTPADTPALTVAPTVGSDLAGPPSTAFQEISHYLTIWPLAVIGGLLASLIYARSRRGLASTDAYDGTAPVVKREFRTVSAVTAAIPVFSEYVAPREQDEHRAGETRKEPTSADAPDSTPEESLVHQ
jgi:hypothetical protein